MIRRTSSGVALYNREIIRELVHTDLPEPVVPAMSRWGILAIFPTMQFPPMSLPTAKETLEALSVKAVEPMTEWILTGETSLLGTSIPTIDIWSGIGAMRTPVAPNAKAISSARLVNLFSRTPWSNSSSYRVTEGPQLILVTVTPTPKFRSVCCNLMAVSLNSFSDWPEAAPGPFFKSSSGGAT